MQPNVLHVAEAVVTFLAGLGAWAVVWKVRANVKARGVTSLPLGGPWKVLVTNEQVDLPPVDTPGSLPSFTKRCRGCFHVKPFADYPASRGNTDGLGTLCYACWEMRGSFKVARRLWQR